MQQQTNYLLEMDGIVKKFPGVLALDHAQLKLRPGILIAVIVRNGEIIIPEGSSCLQAGDDVIIIARGSGILDLNDIYRDKAGGVQ